MFSVKAHTNFTGLLRYFFFALVKRHVYIYDTVQTNFFLFCFSILLSELCHFFFNFFVCFTTTVFVSIQRTPRILKIHFYYGVGEGVLVYSFIINFTNFSSVTATSKLFSGSFKKLFANGNGKISVNLCSLSFFFLINRYKYTG